jgi:hypothetical protein
MFLFPNRNKIASALQDSFLYCGTIVYFLDTFPDIPDKDVHSVQAANRIIHFQCIRELRVWVIEQFHISLQVTL